MTPKETFVCRKCGTGLKFYPEMHGAENNTPTKLVEGYPGIWCPECGLPQWEYLAPRPRSKSGDSLVQMVTGWKPLSEEEEEIKKAKRPRENNLRIKVEVTKSRSSNWQKFIDRANKTQKYHVSNVNGIEIHNIESNNLEDLQIIWDYIKSWKGVRVWINERLASTKLASAYVWREKWNDNEDVQRLDFAYINICPTKCGEIYQMLPGPVHPADTKCRKCGFEFTVIDGEVVKEIEKK